jgi:hypothetical protein
MCFQHQCLYNIRGRIDEGKWELVYVIQTQMTVGVSVRQEKKNLK